MSIKAFCYDASWHTALRILVDNKGDNTSEHRSEFSILSEASSINSLGQILKTWSPLVKNNFLGELYILNASCSL